MEKEILEKIWQVVINHSSRIFWAILIFIFGWFIAKWFSRLVNIFLTKIRLNQVFQRMGWEEAITKISTNFQFTKFFGEIVRWFFVILFLMVTSEILGLLQFSQFLEKVIGYYLNIFIAALIFIISVLLADFSQKIVVGTLEKEKITYSGFLGRVIRWIIWTLAILAILYQLKIVPTLILTVFIGIVGIIAISVGIALGLAGKDLAAKFLKELEERLK